jgi:hypothetical protein
MSNTPRTRIPRTDVTRSGEAVNQASERESVIINGREVFAHDIRAVEFIEDAIVGFARISSPGIDGSSDFARSIPRPDYSGSIAILEEVNARLRHHLNLLPEEVAVRGTLDISDEDLLGLTLQFSERRYRNFDNTFSDDDVLSQADFLCMSLERFMPEAEVAETSSN